MKLHFIEATSTAGNWGKFAVGQLTFEEWTAPSEAGPATDPRSLMSQCGWTLFDGLWVLDLQTGEGAFFTPAGHAKADLDKHRIWVCPLFEPFLTWLYKNVTKNLDDLPAHIHLGGVPLQFRGHRRTGMAEE